MWLRCVRVLVALAGLQCTSALLPSVRSRCPPALRLCRRTPATLIHMAVSSGFEDYEMNNENQDTGKATVLNRFADNKKDDENQDEGDSVQYVKDRDAPAYPEGLHDAAKADRTGPFWSSLGEPDASTGVRPPYLRRDDWHFSSAYTDEERARVQKEEQEWLQQHIELPEDTTEAEYDNMDYDDIFAEKEYMKLEKTGPTSLSVTESEYSMPKSWQEYQTLQERVSEVAQGDPRAVAPDIVAHAQELEQKLAAFYPTFKEILAGEWALLNTPDVEAAIILIEKHNSKKWGAEGPKLFGRSDA